LATRAGEKADAGAPSPARQRLTEQIAAHNLRPKARSEHGAGELVIEQVTVLDEQRRPTMSFFVGNKMVVAFILHAKMAIASPSCGIHLSYRMNNLIFAAGTRQLRVPFADFAADERRTVELIIELSVHPGEYTFSVGCSQPSADGPNQGHAQHRLEGLGPVSVAAKTEDTWPFYGFARLPMAVVVHD